MQELGHTIREARKKKDVGLRQLARMLKVSATYIHLVEMGLCKPPNTKRLAQIADILGLDEDRLIELAQRDEQRVNRALKYSCKEMYQIIDALAMLTREEMIKVKKIINGIVRERKEVHQEKNIN